MGMILPLEEDMEDIIALGEAIRSARKASGITQADLADLAGIAVRTVRAIESGAGNPSLAAVVGAANAVGLKIRAI